MDKPVKKVVINTPNRNVLINPWQGNSTHSLHVTNSCLRKESVMTSAPIIFGILMTLTLASCGESASTIKMPDDNTPQIQEPPDPSSVRAPAARDVDSKGGLTQPR